jgi:hypothetical protein
MIDQGIGNEGFVKTKNKVGQGRNFIPGIGEFKVHEVSVAGK